MNVRFQKTAHGEVAILPRKEYEALVIKAAEADEDAGTGAPSGTRTQRSCGGRLRCYRSRWSIAWPTVRMRFG